MSRFRPGQKVWMDDRELTVKKVHDNPMLPLYQYSFEEYDNLRVGEQSIRAKKDDPKLEIRECYKNDSDAIGRVLHDGASMDELDNIEEREEPDFDIYGTMRRGGFKDAAMTNLNTVSNIYGQPIESGLERMDGGFGSLFFKPDIFFTDWLVKYAGDRIIMDVGAGQGHLVRMIKKSGGRAIGLEPNFNRAKYVEFCMATGKLPNNDMIAKSVQEAKSMIQGGRDKILLVFARPCHSDFVEVGLDIMDDATEALYITIPENLDKYRDLGKYHDIAEKIEFEGSSEDDEVVLSIKKS